jgi:hypothetical protein
MGKIRPQFCGEEELDGNSTTFKFQGCRTHTFFASPIFSQNNSLRSRYELHELLDILFMGLVLYRVQVSRSPMRY